MILACGVALLTGAVLIGATWWMLVLAARAKALRAEVPSPPAALIAAYPAWAVVLLRVLAAQLVVVALGLLAVGAYAGWLWLAVAP